MCNKNISIVDVQISLNTPCLGDCPSFLGPRMITERHDDVVKILVVNEDKEPSKPTFLCMKRGREGKCWVSLLSRDFCVIMPEGSLRLLCKPVLF